MVTITVYCFKRKPQRCGSGRQAVISILFFPSHNQGQAAPRDKDGKKE